jgi:hypothetical protein
MIRPLIAVFLLIIACYSCYYDSEEYLYPQIGCDTINVTYSGSVAPILNDLCVSCHSSSSSIKLDSYENVKIRVDNGSLIGTINHQSGFQPMPQGGAKLDDCRLTIISKWIENGAPNN